MGKIMGPPRQLVALAKRNRKLDLEKWRLFSKLLRDGERVRFVVVEPSPGPLQRSPSGPAASG